MVLRNDFNVFSGSRDLERDVSPQCNRRTVAQLVEPLVIGRFETTIVISDPRLTISFQRATSLKMVRVAAIVFFMAVDP